MQRGSQTEPVDEEMGDRLKDMSRYLGKESFQQAHVPVYNTLESDSKKPLYLGCKKSLMLLLIVLSLVNVKVRYGYSEKKLYFTASGSAGYASRGKYIAKKLPLGKKDIVFVGYGVSKNS